MGAISLESYLTNIYLPHLLRETGMADMISRFDDGNYLFYLIVIIVGVLLAYFGHVLCQRILNKIQGSENNKLIIR